MKQLLLIPALFLTHICFGQNVTLPYDSVTGRINYKQITELSSSAQEKILSNASKWLQVKYNPVVDSILLLDKVAGKMIVKATLTEALNLPGTNQESYLEHIITIDAKDNKCRIQVSDIKFKQFFPATEFSVAGYQEVPIEGIIVGLLKEKFCESNAKAYKKFLIAENVSIQAVLQSFDQYLLQNDNSDNIDACNNE